MLVAVVVAIALGLAPNESASLVEDDVKPGSDSTDTEDQGLVLGTFATVADLSVIATRP